MNAGMVVAWRYTVCALLLPTLAACADVHQRPRLGNHPWPTDSKGQLIEGTARVLALVTYHGRPVEACIDTSSGNGALDQEAIRRVANMVFVPQMKQGWPISSYVRVPITFTSGKQDKLAGSQPATESRATWWICPTQPIAGVPAAESELAQDTQLTIAPTPDGLVPGSDKPWPRDAGGKLVQLDAYEHVLVDMSGRIAGTGPLGPVDFDKYGFAVKNRALDPAKFAGFKQAASARLATTVFALNGEEHWHVVKFHFGG